VPELWHVAGASAVRVFGPPEALDVLVPAAGELRGRVAPDELIVLADPGAAAALAEALSASLAEHGTDALVLDASAGYALYVLAGEGAAEALARVSDLALPAGGEAFLQGRVAEVPARVFVRPHRLDVLVGADVAWFVRHRLLGAGAGAGLVEAAAPTAEPVSGGATVAG
jgi:hypothetical protein